MLAVGKVKKKAQLLFVVHLHYVPINICLGVINIFNEVVTNSLLIYLSIKLQGDC